MVLNYVKEKAQGKEVMVPLTSSLYVPGVLEDNERVLVEVGASYFLEESVDKARDYCERKIKMLTENGQKIAEIVNVKKMQL